MNRCFIVVPKVEHFQVDKDVGNDERRKPEASGSTSFYDEPQTKMKRRERDGEAPSWV